MNVHLNPQSERLVKEQLEHGHFRSAEEVVQHALEALSEREQEPAALDSSEFEAAMDALTEGSDKLPVLPAEATTRAGIYQNHN